MQSLISATIRIRSISESALNAILELIAEEAQDFIILDQFTTDTQPDFTPRRSSNPRHSKAPIPPPNRFTPSLCPYASAADLSPNPNPDPYVLRSASTPSNITLPTTSPRGRR